MEKKPPTQTHKLCLMVVSAASGAEIRSSADDLSTFVDI